MQGQAEVTRIICGVWAFSSTLSLIVERKYKSYYLIVPISCRMLDCSYIERSGLGFINGHGLWRNKRCNSKKNKLFLLSFYFRSHSLMRRHKQRKFFSSIPLSHSTPVPTQSQAICLLGYCTQLRFWTKRDIKWKFQIHSWLTIPLERSKTRWKLVCLMRG